MNLCFRLWRGENHAGVQRQIDGKDDEHFAGASPKVQYYILLNGLLNGITWQIIRPLRDTHSPVI